MKNQNQSPETKPVEGPAVPKTKEEAQKLSKAELIQAYGSKSNAIRGLAALDFTTGDIAKKLEVIYQHARNVRNRPLKRDIKAERDKQQQQQQTQSQQQAQAVR